MLPAGLALCFLCLFPAHLVKKASDSGLALPTMAQAYRPQAEELKKAAWASAMTSWTRPACPGFQVLELEGNRKEGAESWQATGKASMKY